MKIRLFLFTLTLSASAFAQGFAPDSVANVIYNTNITVATGGAATGPSTGLLTATGIDYTVNTLGFPLSEPVSYTYTKTGPNTATIVESDGIRTINAALTFTASFSGTIRLTSPQTTATQTGSFSMSPIPQAPQQGSAAPLTNISTRISLQSGQQINPGFVVGGTTPRRVLIRAVGPGLAALGVPNTLQSPTLAVFSGQTKIGENAGWNANLATTFASVGAFSLTPGSKDAALLLTLSPGSYTALVGGGAGDVILEIYFVD